MKDKEELLELRGILKSDLISLTKAPKNLYYSELGSSNFNRLKNSNLYIELIKNKIISEIEEIDKKLGI